MEMVMTKYVKLYILYHKSFTQSICIENLISCSNFVFPPPTMVEDPDQSEELQSLETQVCTTSHCNI